MRVYRLIRKEFSKTPFTGLGAKLYGGRWNSKNVDCLYCSDSESLCILEVLVHVKNDLNIIDIYDLYRMDIADHLIMTLAEEDYPSRWRNIPPHETTQALGDDFLSEENNPFLALQVPSIISPRDHNYVVNPNHPDMNAIITNVEKIDFKFDLRIFD